MATCRLLLLFARFLPAIRKMPSSSCALSLLEEDLALADYVTAAEPGLGASLRAILKRIEAEEVPA